VAVANGAALRDPTGGSGAVAVDAGVPDGDPDAAEAEGTSGATARHLRGSSLLLAGRLVALVADFAAHVLIVRYLTKGDFGAYTYALAVATLLTSTLVLGLPETIARYAPIFLERHQTGKLVGAFGVAAGVVLGAGSLCVLAVIVFEGRIADAMGSELAAELLAILVILAPSDGLNLVFQGLFAALGRVRSIFFRQYVLVPGLRVLVALALVLGGEGVIFLAIGYVGASVMGLVWYGSMAAPALRNQARERFQGLEIPAREIMSFALPVFLTNVFWIVLLAFSTIALGVLGSTKEVADFQAVLPPARLNYLAMAIFLILFVPTASQLYVRNEMAELRHAYLTTTYWLVVLTVPVLALTTVFAPVFVPTFFGSEYDASIAVLVLLSAGYYVHTAAGPNSSTLKVFRKLRYTVTIDLSALVAGIALNLLLIPVAGALGAALAFLLAIVGRSIPYLWALRRITGIELLNREFLRLQGTIALVLAALVVIQLTLEPFLPLALFLAGLAGVVVVLACRSLLRIEDTFPELLQGRVGRVVQLIEGRRARGRRTPPPGSAP
jgi:O-antigen/teichoic acid export membrane protein